MNNQALLRQARKGIDSQISQSPQVLLVSRKAEVDDGFGGKMPGTSPRYITIRARVSHERRGVQDKSSYPNGLDTNLSLWILAPWNSGLQEDDFFTLRGRVYRVGVVDQLEKFGGVIALQAPLVQG